MVIKELNIDMSINIFEIIDDNHSNELEWEISPTTYETIPDQEGFFIVKALHVSKHKIDRCFLLMSTPERIADYVLFQNPDRSLLLKEYYLYSGIVVPAMASECYGDYHLYYSKELVDVGVEILKRGLITAINKDIVAEDLANILQDEGRLEEAEKVRENN